MFRYLNPVLLASLIFLWMTAQWWPLPSKMQPSITVHPAYALTEVIRPDGDAQKQWNSTAATNYTEIDDAVFQPTIGNTADSVNNGSNATLIDRYTLETVANISSATEITVWAYASSTKNNSSLTVNLYYNGAIQHQGTMNVSGTGWTSASFTGLSLTQANLDDLQIEITGNQGGRSYTVYTLYAAVTYTAAVPVSISMSTDGAVDFGVLSPSSTQNTTASGTNDVQTISNDGGTANLNIRSSLFTATAPPNNTWSFGSSIGSNQVVWEYSLTGSSWTTILAADTNYTFDTAVPQGATRNLYLQFNSPTDSTQTTYTTTITIVATAP